MVEKLQKDSEKSLDVHKEDVVKALAAETGDPAAASSGDEALLTDGMTHAAGGSMFSAALRVSEELSTPSSKSSTNSLFVGGGPKGKSNSIFVGGGSVSKTEHKSVPLVPMSYSDKKATLKNTTIARGPASDIFARSQLAGQSLTGKSPSGGKPAQIKGASISDKTAKMLRVTALKQELAVVTQEMGKSPVKGSKRLMDALKKGDDRAEKFVQSNPDAVKNAAPQFQQSVAPKH